jgi:hypothetical protein
MDPVVARDLSQSKAAWVLHLNADIPQEDPLKQNNR